MKKALAIVLFVCGSLAFAQQSPQQFLGGGFDYKLASPNSTRQSLNMDYFKLDDFKQNTHALTQFLKESNSQRLNPTDNMPIFVPDGKFFLEIYKVDDGIDYKLRIFDLEKSKYFFRSVG